MIASIAGVLISKSPNSIIVDVHGVGYQVFIPLSTFYRLPELSKPVTLHTYTHVREDALQLYGFFHQEEKAVFLLLLGISGIGPKLAVNILSGLPLAEFVGAGGPRVEAAPRAQVRSEYVGRKRSRDNHAG